MTSQHKDPIIGQRFGNVVAQKILGRGGMGAVYQGHHAGLDMKVAIKLLPDLFVGKREMVERFLREARVSGKLQHPNIVRTLDVGQSENSMYYLIMELIEGTDAQRLLDKEKRFAPMRAINICGFVAKALGEAHRQDVIHRDIKPANILIARDGKVKVADFGLARSLANTGTALTLSNQVVGTPNYMAPEQIQSLDADARVDIYALGVTLWQFLTGLLPFDGQTPMAVLLNVSQKSLPMPPEVFGGFPRELREAIVAMTAKDPRRRLPNIDAVLAVLKKARDGLRKAGLDSTAPVVSQTQRVAKVAPQQPPVPQNQARPAVAQRPAGAAQRPVQKPAQQAAAKPVQKDRSDPAAFTRPLGMTAPPQNKPRPPRR
ncbi:serine/threonine-protein kinase [Planctomycetota bacterium]|nr:serine/threonine-protein kinase [Planctomycetota bacterium]